MIIKILLYFRKNTSALLVLSTAIALLVISSPVLPLFNPLLQTAQATTIVPTSMQTRNQLNSGRRAAMPMLSDANATLTFEAKGNGETLTNGTFRIANGSSGQI